MNTEVLRCHYVTVYLPRYSGILKMQENCVGFALFCAYWEQVGEEQGKKIQLKIMLDK